MKSNIMHSSEHVMQLIYPFSVFKVMIKTYLMQKKCHEHPSILDHKSRHHFFSVALSGGFLSGIKSCCLSFLFLPQLFSSRL